MASTRFQRDAPPSDLAADVARLEQERDEARAEVRRLQRRAPQPKSVLAADWLYRTVVVVAVVAALLLVVTLLSAIF